MSRKKIGAAVIAVVVLGLAFIFYSQMTPDEYAPADDEIALHIQFDTSEDIGLLVYDYRADGYESSGGTSNADGSLMKRDSSIIVGLNKAELNASADVVDFSVRFRVITEYVAPNYENRYPDDITKYLEPISWEARFGESYFITIAGDKTNGYRAVWSE